MDDLETRTVLVLRAEFPSLNDRLRLEPLPASKLKIVFPFDPRRGKISETGSRLVQTAWVPEGASAC
jgi:hypothetical protein